MCRTPPTSIVVRFTSRTVSCVHVLHLDLETQAVYSATHSSTCTCSINFGNDEYSTASKADSAAAQCPPPGGGGPEESARKNPRVQHCRREGVYSCL